MNTIPTNWSMYATYETCPACQGDWRSQRRGDGLGIGCANRCLYGRIAVDEPGDRAVTEEITKLVRRMEADEFPPRQLPAELTALQKRVTDAGYGEVHDTEPEWAIVDFINTVCDGLGWAHITRDAFG